MGRSVSTVPWQPWRQAQGAGEQLSPSGQAGAHSSLGAEQSPLVLLLLLLSWPSTNPLALPLASIFSCRILFFTSLQASWLEFS